METTWYAVHTAPRREWDAAQNLIRKGYRAWFPYCWQTVRHARKTEDRRRPVFVRYIFLGVRDGQGLMDAANTWHVSSIVSVGQEPMEIPPAAMRKLMDQCDTDGYMREANDMERLPEYSVGQSVRFTEGAFEGLVAQIAALDNRDGIEVQLELLGGTRRVSVAPSRVEALAHPDGGALPCPKNES